MKFLTMGLGDFDIIVWIWGKKLREFSVKLSLYLHYIILLCPSIWYWSPSKKIL